MSILNRFSKKQISENYTHYALAYGIYPVYIKGICECCDNETEIAVRNWWPDWGFFTSRELIWQSSPTSTIFKSVLD